MNTGKCRSTVPVVGFDRSRVLIVHVQVRRDVKSPRGELERKASCAPSELVAVSAFHYALRQNDSP